MEVEKNHFILRVVVILRTTPEKIRRYCKIDKVSGNQQTHFRGLFRSLENDR